MKERLKRKKLPAMLEILVILGLFLGIVLLAALIYVAADALRSIGWNTTFMQYIEYVILIVAGVLIVKHWMTEYEYALIDDELIIDRYLGRNPKSLLRIKLSAIVSLGADAPDIRKIDRFTFKKKDIVYMVYKQNGQQKCAMFSPSEDLLNLIEQRRARR